jgi:hypothetical protein
MKENFLTKSDMASFFFVDPKKEAVNREMKGVKINYYYFNSRITIKTEKNQILNASLLLGDASLILNEMEIHLNQFDIFFIPPEKEFSIIGKSNSECKIVLIFNNIESKVENTFEIQRYDLENFIPRGEPCSNEKIATFRTVWTAFNNEYFMSGITNIPNESLKTGVVTSVNLEKNKEKKIIEIYSHVHPDFPEVYILLIDDDNYAITQYLINSKGQSVCMDLSNGDGLFFPGHLGHLNFAKPFYKNLKYCSYIWFIPTFGKKGGIKPITLKV